MDESSPSPQKTTIPPEPSRGGVNIQGGDVRAAHDIVAGDVNVAGDSISGQTVSVQRGYSANEVQRLILIVGGLVFATALCFFAFGAVSAAAVSAATVEFPHPSLVPDPMMRTVLPLAVAAASAVAACSNVPGSWMVAVDISQNRSAMPARSRGCSR